MAWFSSLSGNFSARALRLQLDDPTSRRRLRQQAAAFLISAGVSLLLLTAATYHWMHREQQRLISQTIQIANDVSGSQDVQGVTLLSIPKIGLEAAILDGTDNKSLLVAPGHLKKTTWPGEPGNSVIAAHRDTFFRRLVELEHGDDIFVRRGRREFHYAVTSRSIVSPADLSVTMPSSDARLTLITCYPTYYIGPAPKRLIVVATLQAPASPGTAVSQISQPAQAPQ